MTREEVEEIVTSTVIRTLSNLGIDATTTDEKLNLRMDLLYVRAWRKSVQQGTKIGIWTVITVITTGILGLLWMGIKGVFGR